MFTDPQSFALANREIWATVADKSLAEIGYNPGYLSRVERGFLPISTGILAAYETAIGHSLDITPEAGAAPKLRRTQGTQQPNHAVFIPHFQQEGVAYLRGFLDGMYWMKRKQ